MLAQHLVRSSVPAHAGTMQASRTHHCRVTALSPTLSLRSPAFWEVSTAQWKFLQLEVTQAVWSSLIMSS